MAPFLQVNRGDNLQSDIISGFPICPWFRYESRKWTCLAIFLRILFFTCLWCSCSFVSCKLVLGTSYFCLFSTKLVFLITMWCSNFLTFASLRSPKASILIITKAIKFVIF